MNTLFSIILFAFVNSTHVDFVDKTKISNLHHSIKDFDCYISGTGIRMRSLPSTSGTIMGSFEDGELVREIEWSGEWCKVERNSGIIGWVYGKYVICPDNNGCYIVGTNVRMRASASTSGDIVDYFSDGEHVRLIDTSIDGSWLFVRRETGQIGWVHGDYVGCGD